MQHWAFVAPLSNQHVWARDHADSRYYSYLKNSLEHHLSVYGRIWSMGDELGLDRDNKICFCWYAADLEMTLLEPASAQGHNLGSSARLSTDVTPLVRPNRTVLLTCGPRFSYRYKKTSSGRNLCFWDTIVDQVCICLWEFRQVAHEDHSHSSIRIARLYHMWWCPATS